MAPKNSAHHARTPSGPWASGWPAMWQIPSGAQAAAMASRSCSPQRLEVRGHHGLRRRALRACGHARTVPSRPMRKPTRPREVGRGERVLPGLWRLRLPLPWPGVPHCNAWAIAAGDGIVLVDTGTHEPGSLGHLERALEQVRLTARGRAARGDHPRPRRPLRPGPPDRRPRRLRGVGAPQPPALQRLRRRPRRHARPPGRGRAPERRAEGPAAPGPPARLRAAAARPRPAARPRRRDRPRRLERARDAGPRPVATSCSSSASGGCCCPATTCSAACRSTSTTATRPTPSASS